MAFADPLDGALSDLHCLTCLFANASVVSHFFETKAEPTFSLGSASGLDARSHPAELDQAKPSGSSGS
jgi:hypothetical protein